MTSAVWLGIRALLRHPWLLFVLSFNTGIPLICAIVIDAYRTDLKNQYATSNPSFLVIQENGSMGEFYGSRIPARAVEALRALGYANPHVEIHNVTGATPASAVLLRGIELARYAETETYRVVAGRPLGPFDPPRVTMIGAQLARSREAVPGGPILLRGREFTVVGVFETDTIADFEAWVSLRDAQDLLGWGDEVSIFLVPLGGPLKAGDALPGGLAAVERGSSGRNMAREWDPLFAGLDAVTASLGVWSALALAAALGRMAWLRRRDLGVMRVVGFGPGALAAHICAQGLTVAGLAMLLAFGGAGLVTAAIALQTSAAQVRAVFEINTIALAAAASLAIGLLGSVIPAVWLARMPLSGLVRAEWS